MKKYLITHTAVIGRTKQDGATHGQVELTFYSMVEAETQEAASDAVVQYLDPGFTTVVSGIAEVADAVSAEELYALLNHKKVLVEISL